MKQMGRDGVRAGKRGKIGPRDSGSRYNIDMEEEFEEGR
jgi:hypothetical protein